MFNSRDFDKSGKKIEIFMVGIHPERGETGQIAVRNPVFERGTEEWGYRWVDVDFPEPNGRGEREYNFKFTDSAFVLICNDRVLDINLNFFLLLCSVYNVDQMQPKKHLGTFSSLYDNRSSKFPFRNFSELTTQSWLKTAMPIMFDIQLMLSVFTYWTLMQRILRQERFHWSLFCI